MQGVANASLLGLGLDEDSATGVLVCAQEALENIHRGTFRAMQAAAGDAAWHAPAVMARLRGSTLDGVTVLLSKCTLALKVRRRYPLRQFSITCAALQVHAHAQGAAMLPFAAVPITCPPLP